MDAPVRRPSGHQLVSRAAYLEGATMADILVAVLGTGGILLMAAYAALCERI